MDELSLEWTCENQCPKIQEDEISDYTRKLLRIRMLQSAGFPLDADSLNYEEWLDLGRVNQCFQAHERAVNRMF